MNAFPNAWLHSGLGRLLLVAGLGLGLGVSAVQEGRAQAVDDTSRAAPSGVEPAAPEPLPTDDALAPAPDTSTVERAFVEADSLSTFQRGGERLQELFGNVFVRQDTTRLRSQYALRYLNRDELLFVDEVVIYERGDTLRADTVRYDRATEVGRARGRVRLTNGDVTVRSDRATYYAREKRSVFPDSVTLVDSSRVLRARRGTYWSDEERAEFGGGVRLTEPGTTLLSDSLTYYRAQDRSIARGDVFVDRRGDQEPPADTTAQPDAASRTYLFGDWVDNQEQRRYSRVEGNALLVRVRADSAGAPSDTLVVRARRLDAFRTDTHRRLVAVDSVRIWQPRLSAVADSAVYDRVVGTTPPDSATDAVVPIDTTRPALDSAARAAPPPDAAAPSAAPRRPRPDSLVRASSESRRRPAAAADTAAKRPQRRGGPSARPRWATRRWDTPTAQADSALPLEETRLFRSPVTWFEGSQVWGDSIRVRARNRQPDTVFVRGAAFAAQRDSTLDRIQQLKARHLVAFFRADSLRRIRAQPNARAIRFLATEDDSLNGAARTSGDRIELRFAEGTVRRISVVGGTQTTYYRKPASIPTPFRLDGFQWIPDRRPTRRMLLRDERVRRRLDVDLRAPRPVARSGARPRRTAGQDSLARRPLPAPPRRPRSSPADAPGHDTTAPPDSAAARDRASPAAPPESSRTTDP